MRCYAESMRVTLALFVYLLHALANGEYAYYMYNVHTVYNTMDEYWSVHQNIHAQCSMFVVHVCKNACARVVFVLVSACVCMCAVA